MIAWLLVGWMYLVGVLVTYAFVSEWSDTEMLPTASIVLALGWPVWHSVVLAVSLWEEIESRV
jgi:hypothetical protein